MRERIGMKMYLNGPVDYAKTLKKTTISFRGPGPARKKRYSAGREEEGGRCTYVPLVAKQKESRSHICGRM